jgi:Tfp pilus assembly protein PilW
VGARRTAAFAAAALLAAGCGGGTSSSSPDAAGVAVTDFSKAFGAGDGSKACDRLTSAAQAAFVKRVQVLSPAPDCPTAIKRVHDAVGGQVTGAFAAAKASDVKVKGDTATARLTAAGHSTLVRLEKQDGSWRLTSVPGV